MPHSHWHQPIPTINRGDQSEGLVGTEPHHIEAFLNVVAGKLSCEWLTYSWDVEDKVLWATFAWGSIVIDYYNFWKEVEYWVNDLYQMLLCRLDMCTHLNKADHTNF